MSAYKYNVPPDKFKDGMPMNNMNNQVASGLDILARTDRLIVRQKVDLLEAFTGWEESNRYEIFDSQGQHLFYAFEQSDTCMRLCCGSSRGFTINVVDNYNQPVCKISRDFKPCSGCCWCAGCCDACSHAVLVEAPNGQTLGYVHQNGSFCLPSFDIKDSSNQAVLKLEGPGCQCTCSPEFKILNSNGEQVGGIQKNFDFVKEMFTNADNFTIQFPNNLSTDLKAVLLGCLFLIDFAYFEDKKNNRSHD